ncbi:MAG TPA: YitT family protein [Candidatus Krumholzibacteria bacterium]|nr:YitT family protein [Candidatus Krumholzibacteria bacterium]
MTFRRPGLRWFLEYAAILIGASLSGCAIALLLRPNQIVPGGVTGLAMILADVLHLRMGVLLVALNVPLLAFGWRFLGGVRLLARTVAGVVVSGLAIDLAGSHLAPLTNDRLLVIFYGGALAGTGLALVFRGRGTTGGADILGRLINLWFDLPVGQAILGINVVVFGLAAVHYGFEKAAVALMVSFVSTRALDAVLHGLVATRAALVVTERPEAVKETVRAHLNRSVTLLPAEGGFSGQPKTMLYVVVARAEVARLKRRVGEADPAAFVTIFSPQEVMGAGLGGRFRGEGPAAWIDLTKGLS